MSKKKSLGSSPIGFRTNGSLGFIPDLGVAKSKEAASVNKITRETEMFGQSVSSMDAPEKKTVSYYLEVDLIEKVKLLASQKEMCYSALVSDALSRMLFENG
ncbi:MAG TPA: hypothetical protein VF181_12655 [Balneolaceae bacterium]